MVIAKTQNFELQKSCTAYEDIIFKIPKYYLKTPRVVRVGLGVDEMAPGQVLQSSPLNIILPMVRSFIHHSSTLNNLSNQVVKTRPGYLNRNNTVFQHPLVTLPIKLYLSFIQERDSHRAT